MVSQTRKIAYANDAACEFAGKKHTELIGSATALPATVADGYDSSYEKKLDGRTMQKGQAMVHQQDGGRRRRARHGGPGRRLRIRLGSARRTARSASPAASSKHLR